MIDNALKRKLAAGRRVCGALLDVMSEDLVELCGRVGFDFVLLDGQHAGLDPERARGLCRAAELTGMTAIVRVPRNDLSVILAYLDAGAAGIVVPNIADGAQAAAAAEAMRYPPLGQRGASSRSRAAGFGLAQSAAEYYAQANEEVLFLPLVEDPGALAHLPAICETKGVDVVLAGPGDLSLAMGLPGRVTDPRVLAAVEQIRAAAAAAGKPVMTVALDAPHARRLYEAGYLGVIVGITAMLANTARDFLGQLGRA